LAIDEQRIAELSRAAEALVAGPPEYLRAFVGEEGEQAPPCPTDRAGGRARAQPLHQR